MTSGQGVVAVIAFGMGLVFWLTDRESPSSRSLALFLCTLGSTIFVYSLVTRVWLDPVLPAWCRAVGGMEALTFIFGCEWGLRVARTVGADSRMVGHGTLLIRIAQMLSVVYAALVALLPELRYHDLAVAMTQHQAPSPRVLVFLVPSILAGVLALLAGILLLRQRPDRAERVRVLGALAAMPVLGVSMLLPTEQAPVALALGEMIFLYGAMRYHMIQGARGNFMARFLSPQVADLVRDRGLRNAMARKRIDVSVVSVDIRGFTAYAQAHTPEQVMRLLRAFYAAVGESVQAYGGTVKDLAGDGALILIGAPVAYADRASRALALARRLQQRTRPVLHRYSRRLGLGVGVASGSVAVGIVGEGSRFEYMAVGPAVNLASRLCDKALDGEIHVDETTLEESGESAPQRRRRRRVKGIDTPVVTYIIDASAGR